MKQFIAKGSKSSSAKQINDFMDKNNLKADDIGKINKIDLENNMIKVIMEYK